MQKAEGNPGGGVTRYTASITTAASKTRRFVWTQELEESLVELWQEHQCLFDVSDDLYHNRAEKEKRWTEIANSLQRPGEQNR